MTVWKPMPGRELTHVVGSDGRVRNRRTGRDLRPVRAGKYLQVSFWANGRVRSRRLHVVVCEAFHGPRPPGMHARHLDGDELNCASSNLAWGTRSDNMQDSLRHGTNARRKRTCCPRQHDLVEPNLVRSILALGRRNCRACHQARAKVSRARSHGVELDLKGTADAVYAQLVANA